MENLIKPNQVRQNWNTLCVGCIDQDVREVITRDQGVIYQANSSFVVEDPFGLEREAFLKSPTSYWYDIKVVCIDNHVILNSGFGSYMDISELAHITDKRTAVFVVPSSREPLKNKLFYCQLFQMITSQMSWYRRQIYLPLTFFLTGRMNADVLGIIANYAWFFQRFRMAYVAMFPTFGKMRERVGDANDALIQNAEVIAYFHKAEESETATLLNFAVPYTYQNGYKIVRRQKGVPLGFFTNSQKVKFQKG